MVITVKRIVDGQLIKSKVITKKLLMKKKN